VPNYNRNWRLVDILIKMCDRRTRAIVNVLELCDEWDGYSKGESPTTKRIRAAIYKEVFGV
jgi:hypothetical protein